MNTNEQDDCNWFPTLNPQYRLIAPHRSYRGSAKTDYQLVCMLHPGSCFAHVVLSGTLEQITAFYRDCDNNGIKLESY